MLVQLTKLFLPARLKCMCFWGVRLASDLQVSDFNLLLEGTYNTLSHRLKESGPGRWSFLMFYSTNAESARTFLVKLTNAQLRLA